MSQNEPALPLSNKESASPKLSSLSRSNAVKLSKQSLKPSAFGGTSMSFEDGVSVSRSTQLPQKTESEMTRSITEAFYADTTNLRSFSSTPITNGAVPSSSSLALSSTEPSKPNNPSALLSPTLTYPAFDTKIVSEQPSNANLEYAESIFNAVPSDMVYPPSPPASHPTRTPHPNENHNPDFAETLLPNPSSSRLQSKSKPRELWLRGLQARMRAWAARARKAVQVRARGETLAQEVARAWAARAREAVRARARGEALAQEVARAWAARAREAVRTRAREGVRARGEALAQEVARAWAARARETVRAQAEALAETKPPSQAQSRANPKSDAPALSFPPLFLPYTDSSLPSPAERTTHYDLSVEPFSRNSPLCLDGQISNRSEYVVASGGYADVWTGSLGNKTVAIKVVRPFSGSGAHIEISKIFKRSWREYLAWSRLSHPNILECLGFSYDFSPQTLQPSLVSAWMSNGTAMEYIKKGPNIDRVEIVVGIARGLAYLHNMKPTIVHGDLRAGNVLISDRGIACLSDFGLSKVLSDVRGMTTSSELAGSLRWMAPELLHGSRLSVQSDVWAYGMTVLEIFSGIRPYSEITAEAFAMLKIFQGELPARPRDIPLITDDVWTLFQKCWRLLPTDRSSINDVLADIEEVEGAERLP